MFNGLVTVRIIVIGGIFTMYAFVAFYHYYGPQRYVLALDDGLLPVFNAVLFALQVVNTISFPSIWIMIWLERNMILADRISVTTMKNFSYFLNYTSSFAVGLYLLQFTMYGAEICVGYFITANYAVAATTVLLAMFSLMLFTFHFQNFTEMPFECGAGWWERKRK